MADIRINALATTAASTASDDFIAVDGSANGTRKLNAYSPTFGGNLTVSGTGLSSFAGSLGIGTTSPTRPLDVRGSLGMQVNEDNAGTKVISIRSDFAGAGPAINVTTNDPLLFLTNNSERARITSGGNLGIGTTTPGAQLEIGGTNPEIRLGPVSTSSGAYMSYNTAGNYFSLNAVTQGVGYRKLVFANDGGNVLIGTTTDGGQKLQVSGTIASSTATPENGQLQLNVGRQTLNDTWGIQLGNTYAPIARILGRTDSAGNGTGSLLFYTGTGGGTPALALTLDSSQNATFAGTVTLPNDKAIYFKEVGGTAQRFALNSGDVIYIEPDQLHKISIGGAGVTNVGAGGIGVAGNSVFNGSIAIGNTVQTAASVASTHKVTISIGGTTYYLLATNV